jgi:hypothetical protein
VGGSRALTRGEAALARGMFGNAIDYRKVTIRRRKWFPLQPRRVTMAPMGHLHFHPESAAYCEDFAVASLAAQGLFIHEMVHVWQSQTRGRWYLLFARHPFCRYDYALVPGKPLAAYGIEQQAMIVQHAFLLRQGGKVAGAPPLASYEAILPFGAQSGQRTR